MPATFLGVSMVVWSLLALGLAVVYLFIWPKPEPGAPSRPAWAQFVLRWFHSLVWVLLAAAFFLSGAGLARLAALPGLAALVLYGVFVVTILRYRSYRR